MSQSCYLFTGYISMFSQILELEEQAIFDHRQMGSVEAEATSTALEESPMKKFTVSFRPPLKLGISGDDYIHPRGQLHNQGPQIEKT